MAKNKNSKGVIKANPEDIKAMADYARMQMSLTKLGFILAPALFIAFIIIFLLGNR